jgi:rhodanese-related sulfurtransferase
MGVIAYGLIFMGLSRISSMRDICGETGGLCGNLLVKYQVFDECCLSDRIQRLLYTLRLFSELQFMYEFIAQNIMLVLLFITSGAMLVWPTIAKSMAGSREIGTLEVTRLMNAGNALILDIRDNSEFNGGRIPKSKNIPLAEIDKRLDEIDRFKDKPVIITCRASNRAGSAARLLKQRGFADVYQLAGGFSAWQQASLPVER